MLQGLIGAIGLGTTAMGAYNFFGAEHKMSEDRMQMGAEERQMLALEQQQKNLDFTRAQRQLARNSLQARATARANATASGSQLGTGLRGGFGQISGETGTERVKLEQNRELSNQEFGVATSEIDTATALGIDQTNASTAQGEMQLGSAITSSAQQIAGIAKAGISLIPGGGFLANLLG